MAESPITAADPRVAALARALDAVGVLVAGVAPDQWSAPTPCADWDVRRLVEHLAGMNLVFAALLAGAPPPPRDGLGPDLPAAYRDSAAALVEVFAREGVLDREHTGPLGPATGADRLQIRVYDLLAHGWDLAVATGQRVDLPDDLAEQSLRFARGQLTDAARPGRFAPAREVAEEAPALERLVAFLGR